MRLFLIFMLLAAPLGMAGYEKPANTAAGTAPSLDLGLAPTPFVDHMDRLWVAFAHGEHVYVTVTSNGRDWSAPVAVNAEPQPLRVHGENRPCIAVDRAGVVHVTYTRSLPQRFAGHLMYGRSSDGGAHFEPVRRLNDDSEVTGHAFAAMAVTGNRLTIAWIDGRDRLAAQAEGKPFLGSSLYAVFSEDGGRSFLPNQRLAPGMCQCCRLALALDGRQQPVLVWRHIFGDHVRDHAMGGFEKGDFRFERLTHDQWRFEGCPHQGPALAIGPKGRRYHAWFTMKGEAAHLLLGVSDRAGKWLEQPRDFGDGTHPALLVREREVHLVWESQGERATHLLWSRSTDGGAAWSEPVILAEASQSSDHPALVIHQNQVRVTWQADQRFQVIPLDSDQPAAKRENP